MVRHDSFLINLLSGKIFEGNVFMVCQEYLASSILALNVAIYNYCVTTLCSAGCLASCAFSLPENLSISYCLPFSTMVSITDLTIINSINL